MRRRVMMETGCRKRRICCFQAEDGIRDIGVTGVQTCALPIWARGSLPVRTAASGPLQGGVTVLPAGTSGDLHLDGHVSLRPCPTGTTADHLLTSGARAFGPRVLAAVLTGRLSDGAEGVRAVRRAGGRVLVQDPDDEIGR